MTRLHIIGDIFCDIIVSDTQNKLPNWGEDTLAKIECLPGGSSLNTAVHGANYSEYISREIGPKVSISMFSATGQDNNSSICISIIEKYHAYIKNEIITTPDIRTGTCIVMTGSSGRCFLTDNGCVKDISLSWFDKNNLLSGDHIHFGGFYNCNKLQSESIQFFQEAISMGRTTSVTPQYDATGAWKGILELCPYLTFFIGNSSEAQSITVSQTAEKAASTLLQAGCKHVVITKGDIGATLYTRIQNKIENNVEDILIEEGLDSEIDVHYIAYTKPITVTVNVVDTTGAGDAFAGGFLVQWLRSGCITDALRAGCMAGTASVTMLGGSTASISSLESLV
eukprot:gene7582-15542_t